MTRIRKRMNAQTPGPRNGFEDGKADVRGIWWVCRCGRWKMVVTASIYWDLTCTGHSSKHFKCICSLNPPYDPVKRVGLESSFCRGGAWGTEKQITWLVIGEGVHILTVVLCFSTSLRSLGVSGLNGWKTMVPLVRKGYSDGSPEPEVRASV